MGGCFGIYEHCHKFDNSSDERILTFSTKFNHDTLCFDEVFLSAKDFKLGVAFTNKKNIIIRRQNQGRERRSRT